MDEPCSALDPIATYRIEELIGQLKRDFTIAIVTHNMQQASRVSDFTAFMLAEEDHIGRLVEFGPTSKIFTNPTERRTEDYITGTVRIGGAGRLMDAPVGISTSRSGFHRELERLQDEVLVLGSMVEKAITRSVDALRDARYGDGARARSRRRPDQPQALRDRRSGAAADRHAAADGLRPAAAGGDPAHRDRPRAHGRLRRGHRPHLRRDWRSAAHQTAHRHSAHGRKSRQHAAPRRSMRSSSATWWPPRPSPPRTTRSMRCTSRSTASC